MQVLKSKAGMTAIGILLLSVIILLLKSNFFMKQNKLNNFLVFTHGPPDSCDPLKYDSFVNHVAFSSVNSNLVSQYKLGEHTPEIAKSWTVNKDFTKWAFKIRPNFTFSDGSLITGHTVLSSWLRMAKIMKSRNSSSGFFENLVGYEVLSATSESIEGLSATEDTIIIKLKKPMPKLLDKISFGLYSVVHPSHFDKTGKWIMGKEHLITSGAYKIKEWTDKKIILSLRTDYPADLIHPNPLTEIEIFWDRNAHPNDLIDIAMGSELTTPPKSGFILRGAPPSSIIFMRVLSWRNPKSIFFKKKSRIQLRNLFYQNLETAGFKPIRSFFPLIIKDTKELSDAPILPVKFQGSLNVAMWQQQMRIGIQVFEAVLSSLKIAGIKPEKKEITFAHLIEELLHQKVDTTWDITGYGTGILASDPQDDVRFMFKSKEGILLPDESGEILKELDKETLDIQKINELLWDQGLIWPVTHYSSGLWTRPDLDFSEINLVLPPTSFQWIGWKD